MTDKEKNYLKVFTMLERKGYAVHHQNYDSYNLAIDTNAGVVDLWVSTGTFIFRESGFRGGSLKQLLKIIDSFSLSVKHVAQTPLTGHDKDNGGLAERIAIRFLSKNGYEVFKK